MNHKVQGAGYKAYGQGTVEGMSLFPVADSSETTSPGSAEKDVWFRPKACVRIVEDEDAGKYSEQQTRSGSG